MKSAKILLFLLFLFVIPYVSARSDCPYYVTESYFENELVLTYEDSNVINGKAPVFSDFAKGNKSSSFMVFNPNDYEILIVFNYTVEGHGGANRNYGLKVPPYNYSPVRETCYADNTFGECGINQSTLTYFISKPKIMYPKNLLINKTREVCCPNGQMNCSNSCLTPSTKTAGEAYFCDWECQSGVGSDGFCKLDDCAPCKKSADCLSGVCNIAGKCGSIEKCPCSNETLNCQNISCVKPSVKENGEVYSCIQECKSRSGKDGVCQMSPSDKIKGLFFIILFASLMLFGAIYFYRKSGKELMAREFREVQEHILAEYETRMKTAEKALAGIYAEREFAKNETATLKSEKNKILLELENSKAALETEIKQSKIEIESLMKKKFNADIEAKTAVESEIQKKREENTAYIALLKKNEAELKQKKAEIEKKQSLLEREKTELENKEHELKSDELGIEQKIALKTNARYWQQPIKKLFINKENYVQFVTNLDGSKPGQILHDYFAEKQIFNKYKEWFQREYPNKSLRGHGLVVHHIDTNKLNNAIENWAIISETQHKNIVHREIYSYIKGIIVLKERGIKQPHIPELQ